jgi:cell division protein FtsB
MRRARGASRTRLAAVLVVALVAATVLLLGFFPTRSYLAQRDSTQEAERELDELDRSNAELARRVDRLNDPAEIERIAREEYGLVRPGEQAFAVLPPPPLRIELPEVWPFRGLSEELNRGR